MKRLMLCAAALALFAVAVGPVSLAQQSDALFETLLVGVVLPQEIQAGDSVVGTVTLEPEKYEDKPGLRVVTAKIPASSDTLTGNVIEVASPPTEPKNTGVLSGSVIDLPKRGEKEEGPGPRARIFLQAASMGSNMLPLLFRRPGSDRPIATTQVPVETATNIVPQEFEMPAVVPANDICHLTGPLGRNPQVGWGGSDGYVVAGGPRDAYFEMPPDAPPASGNVVVTDGPPPPGIAEEMERPETGMDPKGKGRMTAGDKVVFEGVTLVGISLKASGPTKVMARGSETPIEASVVGSVPAETLERRIPSKAELARIPVRAQRGAPRPGDRGRVGILIENHSPGIIRLDGEQNGAIVKWFENGDAARGNMSVKTKIVARQAGAYNLQARVVTAVAPVKGKPVPAGGALQND